LKSVAAAPSLTVYAATQAEAAGKAQLLGAVTGGARASIHVASTTAGREFDGAVVTLA